VPEVTSSPRSAACATVASVEDMVDWYLFGIFYYTHPLFMLNSEMTIPFYKRGQMTLEKTIQFVIRCDFI
jgi:hypothetical protein